MSPDDPWKEQPPFCPASRGSGDEEYRLRYPVDFDKSFSLGGRLATQPETYFDNVRVQDTAYGAMIEVSGLASDEHARLYANSLERELRSLYAREKIAMFFPTEIHSHDHNPLLFNVDFLGEWPRNHQDGVLIDGSVPSTMACVIPEHLKIIYYGEIRGFSQVVVSKEKLELAAYDATRNVDLRQSIDPKYRLAFDFFSLACARGSPLSRMVHLVTCLEVLASSAGIEDSYVHGIRKVMSMFDVQTTIPMVGIGKTTKDMPLSDALYAIRSNIVHKGEPASADVARVLWAGLDSTAMILLKICENSTSNSNLAGLKIS